MKVGPEPAVKAAKVIKAGAQPGKTNGGIDDAAIDNFLQDIGKAPAHTAQTRRLSATQAHFRDVYLKGSTPKVEARKHVQEKWTHTHLVTNLVLVGLMSIALIICGNASRKASVDEEISSPVGPVMILCGSLMLASACIGVYGAERVSEDLELDDDGLETPGQYMLQVYFHIAFTLNLIILPISLITLSDPHSILNYGLYGDTEYYANISAVISLLICVLTMMSLPPTIMIVTVYEMAQSFLESFAIILVVLGVVGLRLCFSLLEYAQILDDDTVNSAPLLSGIYFIITLCLMLVLLSVFGFGAAMIEHVMLLKVHALSMGVLLLCTLGVLIGLAVADVESAILGSCRSVLQIMSYEWWDSAVSCAKYGGAAMGAQVEVYNETTGSYVYSSAGIGDSANCPDKSQVAFAWEYYSPPTQANDSAALNNNPEGCLNASCCQLLAYSITQLMSILIFGVVMLIICVAIALRSDIWLIRHRNVETERVKRLGQQRARSLISVISVLLLAAVVLIAVSVSSSSDRISPAEIVETLDKDTYAVERLPVATSASIHECSNGVHDGNETDVDCGGSASSGGCSARCSVERKCVQDSDCLSTHCEASTGRCRRETFWEQCSNGIRDGAETAIDCGGGQCRSYLLEVINGNSTGDEDDSVAFLCALGASCSADADCLSQRCADGVCISCQDGVRNGDEGDVDCGSQQCVDYYRKYPEDAPANVSAAGSDVAADRDGRCIDGSSCSAPSQCSSGICHETLGICVSCSNGIRDGDETGVDCGGRVCSRRCPVGEGCNQMYDCQTERCTTSCADGSCSLGVCETVYASAASDADADLLGSSAAFSYIAEECSDGSLSAHETDVDCGGDLCTTLGLTCADGKTCGANRDCDSNLCSPTLSVCVSCENGVRDGVETDVDCGGSVCSSRCDVGQSCAATSDCVNNTFCWTQIELSAALEAVDKYNLSDIVDQIYLPEVDTCQELVTLNVESDTSAVFYEGAALGTIYTQISVPLPQSQAATTSTLAAEDEDVDDADDANVTRRSLSFRHRRRAQSTGTVVSGLQGIASLTEPWALLCSLRSVYVVEDGNRFVVEDAKGSEVSLVDEQTLVVVRTWESYAPDVRIYPTNCSPGHEDGITIQRRDSTDCANYYVIYSSVSAATFRVAASTIITGRILGADGAAVDGAYVRLWSIRSGQCVTNSTAVASESASCLETCTQYSGIYGSCAAPCCAWEEDAGIALTDCVGTSASDTEQIETTDLEGYFEIVIPEFASLESGLEYHFGMTITHDLFLASKGHAFNVEPGSRVQLDDITLAPSPLAACGCKSYDDSSLSEDDMLCKNPVTGHCIAYEGSCAQHLSFLACDNTITPNPTPVPTRNPTPKPTTSPTNDPTGFPSESPTAHPTNAPSDRPTSAPSDFPTVSPTSSPTPPTMSPTPSPSLSPTASPTDPTARPTMTPTDRPTTSPTQAPSDSPTMSPTQAPTTSPTRSPTQAPTASPTRSPTPKPTASPTRSPTQAPTTSPTMSPSAAPTSAPTASPSDRPTTAPTGPTSRPTMSPSRSPTMSPTDPTARPTQSPTKMPSDSPSSFPTHAPTLYPTLRPTTFREPFAEFSFESCSFPWMEDAFQSIQDLVESIARDNAGDASFASLSRFRAAWTESFSLEVTSLADCDRVIDVDDLRESLVTARCGNSLSAASSCEVAEVVALDDVYNVTMAISIVGLGDAYLLDRVAASPQFQVSAIAHPLVTRLRETRKACWDELSTISSPVPLQSAGTFTVEVRVENTYAASQNAKVVAIQNALKKAKLDSSAYMLQFPCASGVSVDVCPETRACSGNGVCCDVDRAATSGCPQLGTCYCNSGFIGYDCSMQPTMQPTPQPTARCVPNEVLSGLLTDASSVLWTICEQEGACESNPLICAYEDDGSDDAAGSACVDGEWTEVFHQKDCRVTYNLGEQIINALFELGRSWRYDIAGDPYLYYVLLDEDVPEGFSAYSMMLDEWSSLDGAHLINTNFALYATEEDMANGTNRWNYANYDDSVGFPRDARPLEQGTSQYIQSYYWKWAKSYCGVAGRKTPIVTEFSFSLCVADGSFTLPGDDAGLEDSTTEEVPTYAVEGSVVDMQAGLGVEATLRLYRGTVPAYENVQHFYSADVDIEAVELTDGTASEVVSTSTAGITPCATEGNETSSLVKVAIRNSTFVLPELEGGSYTLVVEHAPGLAAAALGLAAEDVQVVGAAEFHTRVATFTVVNETTAVHVKVARVLEEGTMLVAFEADSLEVDLVVEFDSSEEGDSCKVSSKMLSDDACSCGGAKLVRVDAALQPNGKAMQVIYFSQLRSTMYRFFVGRTKPVASSSYKKHRDDAHCGPNYPLDSGEPAQCPPVAVTWADGLRELRPCCHITKGTCGLSDAFCKSRYSIDYRIFLDDAWTTQTREDLLCNRPDYLTDDGYLATCPIESPCCGPNTRCGALEYHCDSETSIDYRPMYALVSNETLSAEALASLQSGAEPLEASGATLQVYTSSGLAKTIELADPTDPLNYLDGHDYEDGVASASGTFFRAFCIDASLDTPQLHEYPAPRYFQWRGELVGMSGTCPATGNCTYLRVSGLRSVSSRSDGVTTPELNGVFVKRYATTTGFRAFPGYYLASDSECRAYVTDPRTSRSVWSMSASAASGELDAATCMDICEEASTCEAMYYIEALGSSSQEYYNYCRFHANVHQCGGYLSRTLSATREDTVYEKRSSSKSAAVWYTKLDTMFLAAGEQVHLYKDDAAQSWYLDSDLVPGNGLYASAETLSDSEIPPTLGWTHVLNFADDLTYRQIQPSAMKQYADDCLLGGNFPTLNETVTESACPCGTGSTSVVNCFAQDCSRFPLRIKGENICLEANVYRMRLMSNMCEEGYDAQYFIFNKNTKQLETRVENSDGSVDAYVVYLDEYADFRLELVTSATQVVEDAVQVYISDEYICQVEANVTVTSYTDSLVDRRKCIFLGAAPGDAPLLLDATYAELWTSFTIL